MVSGISGIEYNIRKANRTDGKVQNLAAHIDKETLRTIHRKMKPGKASGIDEVTKEMYEANLDANLDNLLDRMKRGVYRPNPSRRIYIPKCGSDKMRPLGISCSSRPSCSSTKFTANISYLIAYSVVKFCRERTLADTGSISLCDSDYIGNYLRTYASTYADAS